MKYWRALALPSITEWKDKMCEYAFHVKIHTILGWRKVVKDIIALLEASFSFIYIGNNAQTINSLCGDDSVHPAYMELKLCKEKCIKLSFNIQ